MTTEYLNNKSFERIISEFHRSKRVKIKSELIIEDIKDTLERFVTRSIESCELEDLLKTKNEEYAKIVDSFLALKQQLAHAFHILSENIVRYAKFQLIDPDDAIQEGVLICLEKIDKFDPKKGKAFNYMTTCILNHFRQLYRTARNHNELKKKYLKYQQFLQNQPIVMKNGKEMVTWN